MNNAERLNMTGMYERQNVPILWVQEGLNTSFFREWRCCSDVSWIATTSVFHSIVRCRIVVLSKWILDDVSSAFSNCTGVSRSSLVPPQLLLKLSQHLLPQVLQSVLQCPVLVPSESWSEDGA